MTGALTTNNGGAGANSESSLAIIVPVLNESALPNELIPHLRLWRHKGCEVLLVDGGSTDGTPEVLQANGFIVLRTSCGRGRQLNTGAYSAKSSAFIFLHADTQLPAEADRLVQETLKDAHWGRFDVRICGGSRWFAVIATLMNIRSRLSGIATGDQAIFMRRSAFFHTGGFPDQLLMEDIEISKRLGQLGRPACLKQKVRTSGRRWLTHGIFPTIWLMWRLRWAYWRGVPAEQLVERYR